MAAVDFSAMTEQDIRREIAGLETDKSIIKRQVDDAKRASRADGVFSDRKWLTSAEHAGRIKGQQISRLQVELGRRLKESRAKAAAGRSESFERQFMIRAREILPRALYEQVMSETIAAEGGTK